MPKRLDLVGQRFGRLTVIQFDTNSHRGRSKWICRCDCGNRKSILGDSLVGNITKSCGCTYIEKINNGRLNMIGRKFGRWTVLEFNDVFIINNKRRYVFLCECACGTRRMIRMDTLKSGSSDSCGCLMRELAAERGRNNYGVNNYNYKHGLTNTNAYKNEMSQKRQIAKLNQSPELTEIEKKKLLLYYKISEYLGEGWHVDHIQPISKGGLHHPDNLQVLSAELNRKKHDKWPLTPEEEIEYRGIRI